MKKSKLSVGLVTSFIGALALTACNSVSSLSEKEGSLVELVGYNGDELEIKVDEMYAQYTDSNDGTKLYYDAILETLIRYEYKALSELEGSTLKKFSTLNAEADNKIKSAKETAWENANDNGTSYDEEWEKILDSHDCEDENDLREYYLYDLEKAELIDKYFKDNEESLKDQYIGVSKDWTLVPETDKVENVESVYPYHILHVLITLSADKANYIRGTITSSEASKLWQVVRQLIDGEYSFENVAYNLSDDTGSKSAYGDVGIMSTKTSFYNEFKLGIYAYDALLSGVNTYGEDTKDIYNAFGIGGLGADATKIDINTTSDGIEQATVRDMVQSEMVTKVNLEAKVANAIPTVPYEVFKLIGEHYDDDKINGLSPEAGAVSYPRNVLYNQFLNFHSPFLITDEDIVFNKGAKDVADEDWTAEGDSFERAAHDFSDASAGNFYIAKTNFKSAAELGISGLGTRKVLCDSQGNVVIGVRSEAGIHFMVMRKSVFKNTNLQVVVGEDANHNPITKADQSLQDYYTTLIPEDEGFPTTGETYVNMKVTTEQRYYKDRANDLKDQMKSSDFDTAYDYRLYEYLLNNETFAGKITFSSEVVKENIEEYITLLRETKKASDIDSMNSAWESYLKMLRYQNEVRSYDNAMVPTTCAFSFNSANAKAFDKGGNCYVSSK